MLSETPVARAISLGPLLVVTWPAIKTGSSECVSRGMLSVLTFHSSFIFLTLSVVRIFSSFCHAVRCGLPPSVNQSAPTTTSEPNISPTRIRIFRIAFALEPISQRQNRTARIDLRTGDRTELGPCVCSIAEVQAQCRIGIARIEMIKRVECFNLEFQRLRFLHPEFFCQREVEIHQARSVHQSRGRVPNAERICRRQDKTRFVERNP